MNMPSGDASGGGATVFNSVYTLFGYSASALNAPSGLMVTSWMCGQIIDALETLTAEGQPLEGVLRADQFLTTGVSRNGKDAIVAAAFEPRIRVAGPSSSGAMGLGPERFVWTVANPVNERHDGNPYGKGTYYFYNVRSGSNANDSDDTRQHVLQYLVAGVPPPSFGHQYPNIQSVQGYDHGRYDGGGSAVDNRTGAWASKRFGEFIRFNTEVFWTSENGYQNKGTMAQVPFDQHFLAALMAGPDPDNPRGLIMDASYNGDTWQNPEGQQMVFWAVREIYRFLGHEDRVYSIVDDGGHMRSTYDIQRQLDLCDYLYRSVPLPSRMMNLDADGEVFGPGAEYPLDIRSTDDYQYMNWARPGGKSFADSATEYFETYTAYDQLRYPSWWPN
jgi:hypothetical protein